MEEKNTKRKEWIKNAAIIFLIIMLILTFFSNTIMNYSLPQVDTQYVQSNTITAKIRGTGTVAATDPYSVTIAESRTLKSVLVKNGDTVQKGDTLFLLEDSESTELEEAKKTLESLQLEYEKQLLSGTFDDAVIDAVEEGNVSTTDEYKSKLNAATNKVTAAQSAVDSAQADVDALQKSIDLLSNYVVDTSTERTALTTATTNLNNATSTLTQIENNIAYYLGLLTTATGESTAEDAYNYAQTASISSELKAEIEDNYDLWAAETAKLPAAQLNQANYQLAVTNATNALNAKTDETAINAQLEIYAKQMVELKDVLTKATAALTTAQEDKTELITNIQAEMTLSSQTDAIAAQQEVVDELEADAIGAEITAPVSGMVSGISLVAGETTQAQGTLATIQPEGKGFTLEFSVTNQQAGKVAVGDEADLVNSWYYSDINAKLVSIKNDSSNPGKSKILTFELEGDLTAGQSLTLSVGQKSSDYDLTVPNSAIREDNNGKFVLIVETKSSPLGNRYVATRVDVEVLASDDTMSAISGALYGYEYVITTSTKPVEAGQLVRLPD